MITRRSLFTALAGLVGAPVVAFLPKPVPKPFIIPNAAATYQRALAMTVGRISAERTGALMAANLTQVDLSIDEIKRPFHHLAQVIEEVPFSGS